MYISFSPRTSAVALIALSISATASGGTIKLADSFGANPGGEFKATTFTGGSVAPSGPNVLDTGSKFQTFCIEYSENISFGTQYTWSLNVGAVGGGVSGGGHDLTSLGGTGIGDPLDSKTAFLFSSFWKGALFDYSYTDATQRVIDATQLQKLIWYLEGEITTLPSALGTKAHAWHDQAVEATTLGADNAVTWTGLGNVRVLNLVNNNGVQSQDQLVVVPTPTAVLAGSSLFGCTLLAQLVRRRTAQ
jgi:hypothetical protein